MTDESYFRNDFDRAKIHTLIQAHLVEMRVPEPPRPMEVPLPTPYWTGRDALLDTLLRFLSGDESPTGAEHLPVVVVGPSGSGKSAFASKLAALTADRFPDGQLYIDLETEDMHSAARSALLRLGTRKDQLNDSFGGLLAQFRTVTRDKAVLVVVDGGEDAAEGLHFQPASEHAGLAVFALDSTSDQEVHHVRLDDLSHEDATRLLIAVSGSLGRNLSAASAARLTQQYGTRPGTVRRLAGLIRARRLAGAADEDVLSDLLDNPTPDLLEATYRTLTPSAAWLYRLLSVLPGSEFERSILDVFDSPSAVGATAFGELVNAQLVTQASPDRYLVEPAVSRDAARRAKVESLPVELLTAMRASLRWYLTRAQLADREIMGAKRLRRAADPQDDGRLGFRGRAEALAWFQANHAALGTAIRIAALHHWNDEAFALAEAMSAFFTNIPYPEEAERCYLVAVEATRGPVDRARMLLLLGRVQLDLGKFADAEAELLEAREIADAEGDDELVGSAIELLGRTRHWQGRYREALDLYRLSLRYAEQGGRRRAAGIQLLYLGRAHRDLGELEAAERYFEQALGVFVDIEDGRHVLLTEAELSILKAALGVPGAVARADQVVVWLREAGLARFEAEVQERLGAILGGEEGRRRLEAALEVLERVGSVEGNRIRRLLRQPGV